MMPLRFISGFRAEPFQLVRTIEDGLPPGLMVEVPLHRRPEARGVVLLGNPAKLALDLGGVDGVPQVMAGAVGNESNLLGVFFAISARTEFVEQCTEQANEVDVLAL